MLNRLVDFRAKHSELIIENGLLFRRADIDILVIFGILGFVNVNELGADSTPVVSGDVCVVLEISILIAAGTVCTIGAISRVGGVRGI